MWTSLLCMLGLFSKFNAVWTGLIATDWCLCWFNRFLLSGEWEILFLTSMIMVCLVYSDFIFCRFHKVWWDSIFILMLSTLFHGNAEGEKSFPTFCLFAFSLFLNAYIIAYFFIFLPLEFAKALIIKWYTYCMDAYHIKGIETEHEQKLLKLSLKVKFWIKIVWLLHNNLKQPNRAGGNKNILWFLLTGLLSLNMQGNIQMGHYRRKIIK